MRSLFAKLKSLVLPFGRTSGTRIVLDGVNGAITLFDASGDAIISINIDDGGMRIGPASSRQMSLEMSSVGDPALFFNRNAVAPADEGFLKDATFGSHGPDAIVLQTPIANTADDRAEFILAPEVSSVPIDPTFRFRAGSVDIVRFDGGTDDNADARFDHPSASVPILSFARGIVAEDEWDTANGPHSADADTDMVLNNVPQVNGRRYWAHVHVGSVEYATLAAAARFIVTLKRNGAVIDRFSDFMGPSGTYRRELDAWCKFTATATGATDDFVVAVDELADNSTIEFEASSTALRRFEIIDTGGF